MVAPHFDSQIVPDAVRHFCVGRLQLATPRTHVREENDVVLERVSSRDVIVIFVLDAEDQSASLVLLARDWFEMSHQGQVCVWPRIKTDGRVLSLSYLTQRIGWTWRVRFC